MQIVENISIHTNPLVEIFPLNLEKVKQREQEALRRARANAKKIGKGVPRGAQELFNNIDRQYVSNN